jgi:hypothetical protein
VNWYSNFAGEILPHSLRRSLVQAQANFEPTFSCINTLTILKPSYYSSYLPAYNDGTDRVFRNVGVQNSDARELPRRKHTTLSLVSIRPKKSCCFRFQTTILVYIGGIFCTMILKDFSIKIVKINSKNFSLNKTIWCFVIMFALLERVLGDNIFQLTGLCLLTIQKFT